MAIPRLGFKTKTACYQAIKKIIDQYGRDQEFFDPLLQRLFIEHPYSVSAPGPTFTKFKMIRHELPGFGFTDRWFMAYHEDNGWCGASWRDCCLKGEFDLDAELKRFAGSLVATFKVDYKRLHPICEFGDCRTLAADAHHKVPMKLIVAEAIKLLTLKDKEEIIKNLDPFSVEMFSLPTKHKFTRHIVDRHKPGILMSVCVKHHYELEGKKKKS